MTGTLSDLRVLVVEDEYFIASDLRRALTAAGAQIVGPVADPDAGLALATAEALDVAVLDVNLDGRTSYAIADRLAARGVPFVFLTGYDVWALRDGYRATPRLAKPFAMNDLLATLRQLTAGVPA